MSESELIVHESLLSVPKSILLVLLQYIVVLAFMKKDEQVQPCLWFYCYNYEIRAIVTVAIQLSLCLYEDHYFCILLIIHSFFIIMHVSQGMQDVDFVPWIEHDFFYFVLCIRLRRCVCLRGLFKQKQIKKYNFGNDLVHCTADWDQVIA